MLYFVARPYVYPIDREDIKISGYLGVTKSNPNT